MLDADTMFIICLACFRDMSEAEIDKHMKLEAKLGASGLKLEPICDKCWVEALDLL
jgi:hypothetical protein